MSIFFDSSTLISMAMTCSLPVLRELKKSYKDNFYITDSVRQETIGRAMQSLRFRYEGHRINELVDTGVLKIYPENRLQQDIQKLLNLINSTYSISGKPLKIVQLGEISALTACLKEKAELIALDERTTRLVIENPEILKSLLENKLHSKVDVDEQNMETWESFVADKTTPMRSTEFAAIAWEKGILGDNKDVLYGLLWALKFAGCAVTEEEINIYTKRLA